MTKCIKDDMTDVLVTAEDKRKKMTEDQKHAILKKAYNNLTQVRAFKTDSGGDILSTPDFVYLGTFLHFTL